MDEILNNHESDTESLLIASEWIRKALMGSLSTGVAVIGVAFIGLAMLTGNIPVKRAIFAAIGVFLVSVTDFADGPLISVSNGYRPSITTAQVGDASSLAGKLPSPVAPTQAVGNPFDPYSGS